MSAAAPAPRAASSGMHGVHDSILQARLERVARRSAASAQRTVPPMPMKVERRRSRDVAATVEQMRDDAAHAMDEARSLVRQGIRIGLTSVHYPWIRQQALAARKRAGVILRSIPTYLARRAS